MKKLILCIHQLFCHHKYQYTEINHDGINTVECKWCGKRKIVKVLPLLALVFVMFGCNLDLENQNQEVQYLLDSKIDYSIKIIDSCEYIRTSAYDIHYEHKGNCRYCAERRKKTQEELIRRLKED